ncbi:MAG: MCP four helix bundle domain-containing protein [Acidobacteriaceae bacterium]|nr:MCP four helix bundle domain-containing protein [Acidobacteriaceae bacterium]
MTRSGSQSKRLLLIGFGGLLLLLAFTGLNAVAVLNKIQLENESIRKDYLNRNRILEQLRSDIYLSGTYARDLLLEPDPAQADLHRKALQDARIRIEATNAAYARILRGEERVPFLKFTQEVNAYFDSLRPALQWDASERRQFGYSFMKNSLLPRRMVVVQLADQIGQVNQKQLESGNRQVSNLFSSFRRSLILLLVLALISGILLAAGSIYGLLRLERESASRFEEVEQARSALRDLSGRLLQVQESERRALSRELHDEVGQSLSGLLLGLGNVAATISPEGNADSRAQLRDLRRLAERTVAVVRDMSLLLRPSMLDDLGLVPALQWQAREISRTTNLTVQIYSDSVSDDLPDEHKTCIYRVVQEALHNITRHAQARTVQIHLTEQKGAALVLTIEDDGQGFLPEREKGVGLLGMEERVVHLQGSFALKSQPGRGTLIQIELPLSDKFARVAL